MLQPLLPSEQDSKTKMDDYDRENLQFLLNATPETLADWYHTVDEDDHAYAAELLAKYQQELALRTNILECENVSDVTVAAEYLKRFTAP